jgi:hypothetical protein
MGSTYHGINTSGENAAPGTIKNQSHVFCCTLACAVVIEETVALLFNLKPDEIDRIDCWRHVVYVHGRGVSKFVSYADFPPIVTVEQPTYQDFSRWRKRWRNRWTSQQAPEFWTKFYQYQFNQADTERSLLAWGKLVAAVKTLFSAFALEQLREAYKQENYFWENF